MHKGFKIKGEDKRMAYEIAVGEGQARKQGLLYITNPFTNNGNSYFCDKEGYSILVVLQDRLGHDIFGGYIPLQSLKQKDNSYLYTSGTKDGPGSFPFPQYPDKPLIFLQTTYRPSQIVERGGDAIFQVWPYVDSDAAHKPSLIAEGKTAIGEKLAAGEYNLSFKEVRYWVSMNVRYEPGKPIILTSLWVGLAGMIITTIGRIWRGRKKTIGA